MDKLKCRKCGEKEVCARGVCRNCYNKMVYYNKNNTPISLQEFITAEKLPTRYKRNSKAYEQFLELRKTKDSVPEMAKDLGVSRQTIYTYIQALKGEKSGK